MTCTIESQYDENRRELSLLATSIVDGRSRYGVVLKDVAQDEVGVRVQQFVSLYEEE